MDFKKLKTLQCRNPLQNIRIDNVLYTPDFGKIIGFEGVIIRDKNETFCSWNEQGVAYTDDRGYDLVQRLKFDSLINDNNDDRS